MQSSRDDILYEVTAKDDMRDSEGTIVHRAGETFIINDEPRRGRWTITLGMDTWLKVRMDDVTDVKRFLKTTSTIVIETIEIEDKDKENE